MKNKKLIATVASLCLVLVAVVAAVIGVLAAQTQSVSNKVKVSYVANNVNADVSIFGRRESDASFTNTSTGTKTVHFAPQDAQTVASIETNDLALEWGDWDDNTDTPQTLNKYVVYQFKFENKSATKNLQVKLTYTEDAKDNVELRWYQSTAASLTPTINYSAAGALQSTSDSLVTVTSGAQTGVILTIDKVSNDNAQIAYIYLVVAVSDINSDAHFGLGGTETYMKNALVFELNSVTPTAQQNNG